MTPIIVWFRRDLRLSDHEALSAAAKTGRPIIPLFIRDQFVDQLGAAPKWRFGLGIEQFAQEIAKRGGQLILRSGDALEVLKAVMAQTGADTVFYSRAYDPQVVERDKALKASLEADGAVAQSFMGHLLFEPWAVRNKTGGEFKVYSPFWKKVSLDHPVSEALGTAETFNFASSVPTSEALQDWKLGHAMNRGAEIVRPYMAIGEAAAQARLVEFLQTAVNGYRNDRDFPAGEHTSRLSENLTYGEISPRQIWHAGQAAMAQGAQGAEHFCKELVWREFAYHVLWHAPELATENWKAGWHAFSWRDDNEDAQIWRMGQTGERFVDAAMRELYVTGTMHNRLRMIAASYLTKHLLTDWRVGRAWFDDCLVDWDPASNAMGWQWVAGCGPDAAPYFRVFNPATQAEKFDPDGIYRDRWLDAGRHKEAQSYFEAIPRSWALDPTTYPTEPLIDLPRGRNRALEAYESIKKARENS